MHSKQREIVRLEQNVVNIQKKEGRLTKQVADKKLTALRLSKNNSFCEQERE